MPVVKLVVTVNGYIIEKEMSDSVCRSKEVPAQVHYRPQGKWNSGDLTGYRGLRGSAHPGQRRNHHPQRRTGQTRTRSNHGLF